LLIFGIQEIGAIPVPVSPIYTPFELDYWLMILGPKQSFAKIPNFRYVTEVFEKKTLKRIIVTNLADLLPWWKRTIGRALIRYLKGQSKKTHQVCFFSDLLRRVPNQPPKVTIKPEETTCLNSIYGWNDRISKRVPSSHAKCYAP